MGPVSGLVEERGTEPRPGRAEGAGPLSGGPEPLRRHLLPIGEHGCPEAFLEAFLERGGVLESAATGDFTGRVGDVRVETSGEMSRAECPLSRLAANGALDLGLGRRLCLRADDWSILPYRGRGTGFFPDVFHPQFAESCDWLARELCTVHRKDRTLTGYYLDDGIRWPTIDDVLRLDEAHPARRAAVAFVAGPIGDRFSRKWLITLSLIAWSLMTFMMGFVGDWRICGVFVPAFFVVMFFRSIATKSPEATQLTVGTEI